MFNIGDRVTWKAYIKRPDSTGGFWDGLTHAPNGYEVKGLDIPGEQILVETKGRMVKLQNWNDFVLVDAVLKSHLPDYL
jgi:hypothetical protein